MRRRMAVAGMLLAGTAAAAPPEVALDVATDIPPVHALVGRVMHGVGEPALILPPGGSPHGHAMRPSEARALAGADVVVWMGEALTPWVQRAIESLGPDAVSLELLEVPRTVLLPYREGIVFGADDEHGAGADSSEPADEHAQDKAKHAHGHEPGDIDPHAWLDPVNAQVWLAAIGDTLAAADPANADAYHANAAAGQAEIAALARELSAQLAPVRGAPFIVYHDGYRYFEERFGIAAAGAISLADASEPSAARVAGIRDVVRRTGAACVFAEPQFSEALVGTVTEGTGAQAATLDPIGASLEPGPGLYAQLLRDLADGIIGCLDPAA